MGKPEYQAEPPANVYEVQDTYPKYIYLVVKKNPALHDGITMIFVKVNYVNQCPICKR